MKWLERFDAVLRLVSYPGIRFLLNMDPADCWLQVVCPLGTDNVTGKPEGWKGRKWRLSQHMTDGELVQTAFMAVMAANEHETRERFKFSEVAVFQPHFDIYSLRAFAQSPRGQPVERG